MMLVKFPVVICAISWGIMTMSTLFSNIFARFHILTFSDSTLSGFDASISFPNSKLGCHFWMLLWISNRWKLPCLNNVSWFVICWCATMLASNNVIHGKVHVFHKMWNVLQWMVTVHVYGGVLVLIMMLVPSSCFHNYQDDVHIRILWYFNYLSRSSLKSNDLLM